MTFLWSDAGNEELKGRKAVARMENLLEKLCLMEKYQIFNAFIFLIILNFVIHIVIF